METYRISYSRTTSEKPIHIDRAHNYMYRRMIFYRTTFLTKLLVDMTFVTLYYNTLSIWKLSVIVILLLS